MHAFSATTGQPLSRGSNDPWDNLEPRWRVNEECVIVAVRMARGWRVCPHPVRWVVPTIATATELWEPASRNRDTHWPSIHTVRAWLALGGRP